jgi:hypothetical protein
VTAPAQPVDNVGSPDTTVRPRGWWRRNIWGLLALLPLTAGVIAINADLLVEENLTLQPRQPIVVALGESVSYGDASVRLVSLTQVEPNEDLVGYEGSLAPGLTIWQGIFDIDPDSGDSFISGCKPTIEDGQGRLYGNYPSELNGGRKGWNGLTSDAVDEPAGSKADPYVSTSYFVMPTGNDPAGVRVVCESALPRYVRFAVA